MSGRGNIPFVIVYGLGIGAFRSRYASCVLVGRILSEAFLHENPNKRSNKRSNNLTYDKN